MSGALQAVFQNQRSFGPAPDAQFNYVTMLLHGDGTNGAQNNTFLDSSTNNFTITRNGNTTQGSFSPYGSNWSNYFSSATTDYLTISSSADLSPQSSDFCIEAWVYITTTPSTYQTIYASSANGIFFGNLSSSTDFGLRQRSVSDLIVRTPPPTNTWTHVAVSRSGTNLRMFYNGVQQGSTVTDSTSFDFGTVGIGSIPEGGFEFPGYISNLRFVKGSAVYTSNFTPSTTPLTAISGTQLLTCQSNRFIDNSTNNFSITVNNTPKVQRFNPFGTSTAYSTSVIGGSAYFDGTGDYLRITNSAQTGLGSGDFTVESWIYLSAVPSATPFAIVGNGERYYRLYVNSGSLQFWWRISATDYSLTSSAITWATNTWYHVAAVRNGTSITLYLNGTSVGTTTTGTSGTIENIGDIGVGGLARPSSVLSWPFNGYLSNTRLVVGTAVYTGNFTPPTAPLTAITNTSLLTNYTNAGIYDNAMMNDLETVGNAQISTSVKKYGTGSLYFDGTGDWLIMPYGPTQNFGTGSFTIEMWAYLNSLAASYYVPAGTWGVGTSDEWLIQIQNNGSIRFLTTSGSSFYSASITTATWYHIAIVRSGSTVTIYVNGTSVGSYTCSNSLGSVSKTLYIGSQAGTWDWNGYIDDFRITNGYARYTASFTPPTAALPDIGPN